MSSLVSYKFKKYSCLFDMATVLILLILSIVTFQNNKQILKKQILFVSIITFPASSKDYNR